MIPTFSGRGRDQQAKHAGGKQAAQAEDHRAQRALIRGNAHARLQAGRAHRGHAVADAVEHTSSTRTAMEITTTKASIMLSEASYALPPSTKARACTQHAPSVEVVPVPVRRATHKKWGSHPSAGIVHCGHGGVLFSIAEESSVAKDHRSRTRTTRPRCASSCRARRGESASKRAPHERSGAERVSDLVSTPRKTRQQSIHPLKHQGIPAARETRPAKDEATAKTPSARVIKSRARAAQYAALMDKARAFRVKSILGFWSRAATPGAPAQPPPPLLPPALPRPPTPPPLPPPPEPQASDVPHHTWYAPPYHGIEVSGIPKVRYRPRARQKGIP